MSTSAMKTIAVLALVLIASACHADEQSCKAARGLEHRPGSNWYLLVTAKTGKVSILGPFTWKRAEWIRATLLGEPATKAACDALDEAQKKADQWNINFENKLLADLKGVVHQKCNDKFPGWYQIDGVNAEACLQKDGRIELHGYSGYLNPYEGAYAQPDSEVSAAVLFR